MSDTPRPEEYPALISLAVHEFRTPASVVGGYLRMLARDTSDPLSERHRHMIEEAEKSCARLVAIVAELSDVGKIDSGVLTMNRAPLDLFVVVREVAASVHEARDREVHLQVDGPQSGAGIAGDKSRLEAAFHAIFRAILRETAGPATVVANCRIVRTGGASSAVVVVGDSASVQVAYDSPRKPFDDRRGGMGLALPLARRVIEAHGGELAGTDSKSLAIVSVPLSE